MAATGTSPSPVRRHKSAYDRYVAVMRPLLAASATLLAAALIIWPMLNPREDSFVLNKQTIPRGEEALRITEPVYEGTDAQDRLFTVAAAEAYQTGPEAEHVFLRDLQAKMTLDQDRSARVNAQEGVYRWDAQTLRVPGAMTLATSDGYRLEGRAADIDLHAQTVRSGDTVWGDAPLGTISAGGLAIDVGAREAAFEGGVALRITPAAQERP